jgi:pimeloyl-ACP methyl ester carboxylesterase
MTLSTNTAKDSFSGALNSCWSKRRHNTLILIAGLLSALASAVCAIADDPAQATPSDRTFTADHDGSPQKFVLVLPQEYVCGQSFDMLIALHGHGADRWQFVRDSRDECRAARDVAAANRMIFISPDYRATTSWMGPAAEADLVQIISLLRLEFSVKRVFICGGSMGGTGALTFATLHPKLVDGVVCLNGTANLVTYERFQDAIAQSFGGSREHVPEQYRQRSAEFFPERFTMPLAATSGGKDDIVPSASVLRLMKSVGQHNPDVLSLHQPEGPHSTTYADARAALDFVISRAQSRSSR